MKRGFSLFEILLALFIMSMLVVGGIQWSQRKHEEAAARQLGLRLFQYGMAVTEYARQNPHGYTVDNPPPEHLFGVDWLKNTLNPESCYPDENHCKPFLGPDFNLNLKDLAVRALVEDNPDSQIHVELSFPTSSTIEPLRVKLISLGKVFRYTTGTQPFEVDISLDSRAVHFANQYHDQSGTAQITYTLAPMTEEAMITGVPSTTAPNIDAGYLRTDGMNEMDNSIRFSPSAMNKKIEGVEQLDFADQDKSVFRGLEMTVSAPCNVTQRVCKLIPVTSDHNNKPTNACFLSQTTHSIPGTRFQGNFFGCTIYQANGSWMLRNESQVAGDNSYVCAAICLSWGR